MKDRIQGTVQGVASMSVARNSVLCRYTYDPLDRLADCRRQGEANTQRFYRKNRLATETQGQVQRSIFQHDDQLLAQQQRQAGTVETILLATDQQRSVLNAVDATQQHPLAYAPYGHRSPAGGLLSLLGFNGERPDPVTGHYVLGNGYRAFNPVLMRFNSPDSWSPFGEGGLNAYAYCAGDPVNFTDPTGHLIPKLLNLASNFNRALKTSSSISANVADGAPGGLVAFVDEIVTTTRHAFTRDETFTGSMSPARQHLKNVIDTIKAPSPYAQKLGAINENLASNKNYALSMDQAQTYGTLAQDSSAGRISDATAHFEGGVFWVKKLVKDRQPDAVMGAILNFGGAFFSGDAIARKTGDAIRRGSWVLRRGSDAR
jgi:RHS repeat-associated protein